MTTRTFDLTRVAVTFRGLPISGFVEGDAVEITFSENLYNKSVGADGSVSRAAVNNVTAEVAFNLQSTSPANATFQDAYAADRADGSGWGALLIEDTLGSFRFFAAESWIMKVPDLTLGTETPSVTWTLDTGQVDPSFIGI
ncbi:MAG: phage protein, partial [Myxococcota bacterium]